MKTPEIRELKFFGVYDNPEGTLCFNLGFTINPGAGYWGFNIGFLSVYIIIGPHHVEVKPLEDQNLEQ